MSNTEEKDNIHIYCCPWDVGYHPAFAGSIHDCVMTGVKYGCYALQFFLGSPKSFNKRHVASFDDISRTKKLLEKFPMHIFSHFPYLGGLVGSVETLAWSGDEEQDAKMTRTLKALEYELSVLSNFCETKYNKRSGVVIHPGSYRGKRRAKKGLVIPYEETKQALITVAKSINKINFTEGGKLLLENCAGEGTKVPRTFEDFKIIFDHIDDEKQEHVGVCVDTAHIWGVGEYDISKIEEVDRMFDDFDRILGMDRFTLLHLNDSKVELGAKKDEHACLGNGYIWGGGFASLIHLLNKCKQYGIPAVLETHGLDMIILSCLGRD